MLHWDNLLIAILGWAGLLSLIAFAFCIATLRSHVDEEKVRREEQIATLFQQSLPPERILTAAGKRRAKCAKMFLVFGILFFGFQYAAGLLLKGAPP
jgi:hypothetical protein